MNELETLELSVVVPVYGRFDLLESCLLSIRAHTNVEHEVLVIDDATPGGPPRIAAWHGRVIRRKVNGGFVAASNTGVARARGRLVAIVNSDAVVPNGWATALRSAIEAGAGLAAAVQFDDDGLVVEAGTVVGGDGHVVLGYAGHDPNAVPARRVVPAIGAACVMAFRRDFRRWGGFSRSYGPGYYEDIDLSLLLGRLGRQCVVVGDARVRHAGQGSFGSSDVRQRLRVGRAVLARRRRWELCGRPSVHGWEQFPARGAYAWSYGSAGRALVVGEHGRFRLLLQALAAQDVATRVLSADKPSAESMREFPHWADVVIGARPDLARVADAIDSCQPRAVPIEVVFDRHDVVDPGPVLHECASNGLGREQRGAGETLTVGSSRCRSMLFTERDLTGRNLAALEETNGE